MKAEKVKFELVGDFLIKLKRKFRREDNKLVKVVELKQVKKKGKMIEKFIQEFKQVARDSKYERQGLIEEFK